MLNAAHPSTKIFTLLPKAVALVVVVGGGGTRHSFVPVANSVRAIIGKLEPTIDAPKVVRISGGRFDALKRLGLFNLPTLQFEILSGTGTVVPAVSNPPSRRLS